MKSELSVLKLELADHSRKLEVSCGDENFVIFFSCAPLQQWLTLPDTGPVNQAAKQDQAAESDKTTREAAALREAIAM